MSDRESSRSEDYSERLEAYLDGLLTPDERLSAQRQFEQDPGVLAEIKLQNQIDQQLRSAFNSPPITPLPLGPHAVPRHKPATTRRDAEPRRRFRKRSKAALWMVAACAAWLVVFWNFRGDQNSDVKFVRRPLREIYRDCVSQGFTPYYVCDDAQRFRETFEFRHQTGLRLEPMPEDRYMVGLSYLHGLSRYTTAMLARVKGAPVVVFVDRLENDSSPPKPDGDATIHCFRRQVAGLVMYELTPFGEPLVTPYLQPIDERERARTR